MLLYKSIVNKAFEEQYIALRKKENRIYSIKQLEKLPEVSKTDPHFTEWKIRKASAGKFIQYLKRNNNFQNILELGCGNGWFSNYLAQHSNIQHITGLDINEFELKQADEVFDSPKISWLYADIFSADLSEIKYDLIIFNGSIQYFSDLKSVIQNIKKLLNPRGEIHIIDSPFYNSEKEKKKAHLRTEKYYSGLGFREMSKNYTPHLYSEANEIGMEIVFRPQLKKKLFEKLFNKIQSPFPWLVLKT